MTGELELFAAAPWGTGPDAIEEALEDHPPFSEVSDDQRRRVRTQPRIRLDDGGGLHALADAGALYHFDAGGRLTGRTAIQDAARVMDFAVGRDGSAYLLEPDRLRRVDPDGDGGWSRTGPLADQRLHGTFDRLLADGRSRLFASAPDEWGPLAEIDRGTGRTIRVLMSGTRSDAVYMDASGRVQSIVYLPETRSRALATFEPDSGSSRTVPYDDDAYGWLTWPLGVDARANVYGYKDGEIARVAPDGGVGVIAAFDGAAVTSGGSVITSRAGEPGSLHISRAGADVTLHTPGVEWPRLIHVDEQGRLYVFGGESPGSAGTLLVYDVDGRLDEMASPPGDLLPLEARLAPIKGWIVDGEGRVYVPLADGAGFRVLRVAG